MAISVASKFGMTTTETLGQNATSLSATSNAVIHNAFTKEETLSATASGDLPAVEECAFFVAALTAGAATINLAALTSTNGRALDATGRKLVEALIINPNANAVSIAQGASNGYTGAFSSGGWTIPPKGRLHIRFVTGAATIASGVRTLDLSGTGSDTVQIGFLFGPVV